MNDSPQKPETATTPAASIFNKGNLALALATLAFVLALAPYLLPNIQGLVVRGGLMAHPEVLIDASNALKLKQETDLKQSVETAIKANEGSIVTADDPVIGPVNAPITIVEFHDYLCPACRAGHPHLMQLLKANPDVRLVVKEYPIIGGENSRYLAALALAARDTGHYEAVHNALYANDVKTPADLEAALKIAGVNPQDIIQKAQSPAVQSKIDETLKLGNILGIQATPNFIVDGILVNGTDINQVQTLIAAERTKLQK